MDFSNPLGIEYRVVKNAEHQGQPVRIVSGARTYAAEPEELWDALTDGQRIARWFSRVSGDLKLGGRYQIEGNAGGEITRCDPPAALDVTWEFADNLSWVTVRLEPVADGTRLTLNHIMAKDPASEAHWKQYGPGATGVGWDFGYLILGLHLASGGEAVQEEQYNAWIASPEGKAFIRICAARWSDAHVAGGEDAPTAAAMAEQTAKFYCGE